MTVGAGIGHGADGEREVGRGDSPPPAAPDDSETAFTGGTYQRAVRRTAAMEVAVGVLVLSVTTVLTNTPPARTQTRGHGSPVSDAPAINVSVPFDTGQADGKGRGTVALTLNPGHPGINTLKAAVLDPHHAIERIPELNVALTLPARGMGPLKAVLETSGRQWVAHGLRIPTPGAWKLAVTVRTSDIDQVTETKTVRIPEQVR